MEILNLVWNAEISKQPQLAEDSKSLLIEGTLLDISVNKNGWAVPEDELENIARQVNDGVQLRIDHSASVRDIIGATTFGEVDKINKKVNFKAEVDDPDIIRKIIKRRIKTVSIGAQAEAFCSECNKRIRPVKTCKCENSHPLIRNSKIKEVSLISSPAYQKSEFVPVSFVASVEDALNSSLQSNKTKVETLEKEKIMEEKRMTDEKITATETKTETIVHTDPKVVEALASVSDTLKGINTMLLEQRKAEETKKTEVESAKAEAEKKEAAVKAEKELFEKIRAMIKEELAKKPTEEKKEGEEDEEEEEEMPPKKKEEVGAKVETEETMTAENKAKSPWDAAWGDLRKAAKDLSII